MSNNFLIQNPKSHPLYRNLFISQPFIDIPNDEIVEGRERILEKAKIIFDESFNLIWQYDQQRHPLHDTCSDGYLVRLNYLAKSIQMMSNADLVIFSKGYNKSKECVIEEYIAQTYNMDYYYEIDGGLSLPENPKHIDYVSVKDFIKKVWDIEHLKLQLVPKGDLEPLVKRYLYSEPADGSLSVDEFLDKRIKPHLTHQIIIL